MSNHDVIEGHFFELTKSDNVATIRLRNGGLSLLALGSMTAELELLVKKSSELGALFLEIHLGESECPQMTKQERTERTKTGEAICKILATPMRPLILHSSCRLLT